MDCRCLDSIRAIYFNGLNAPSLILPPLRAVEIASDEQTFSLQRKRVSVLMRIYF